MGSKDRTRLEPITTEDQESPPPCGVSTPWSGVVDMCISPTFLDPREATPFIAHRPSFSRVGGHLALLPLPYSTLYLSHDYGGEALGRLIPCRRGSPVVSWFVNVLRECAPVMCSF